MMNWKEERCRLR